MSEFSDIVNFTRDELLQEYRILYDRFQELRESSEVDKQKIHELKRSLDTATAAQAYLSQELEQCTVFDNKKVENELRKAQDDLQEMRRKYGELESSFMNLQQDYGILLTENTKMSKCMEKSFKCKEENLNDIDSKNNEYMLQIEMLENENVELLHKMEDFEERSVRDTRTIAECEKNIEILRDQIECLEENLQSKRNDLDENLQILESTQEQLADANAKIAALSAAPNNSDRKGNSLFAEVDDQRQAMKRLLTAQKKSYVQMKKIYDESENEIRRLKRENISMHTELDACSKIFCNADKIYQEKLNDRIRNLMNQNEILECKLKWTHERLKELADNKGILFLDSMLSFCKKETDELKGQLHSARIQKASLEEQLRNAQQEMARWRFESLKSRCILIDREHLLTDNKIPFKPIYALEYNISEKEKEEAKPRIVSNRRSNTFENVIEHATVTSSRLESEQELSNTQKSIEDMSFSCTPVIKKEQMEQLNTSVSRMDTSSIKEETSIANALDTTKDHTQKEQSIGALNKSEKTTSGKDLACIRKLAHKEVCEIENYIDLSENLVATENNANAYNDEKENNSIHDVSILNKFAKLKAKPPSPMRPSQRVLEKSNLKTFATRSILTKPNDIISKDSCKNVKFSSDADIVHNLSEDNPSPAKDTSGADSTTTSLSNENTIKQSRIKSNIIVRRVFLNSKHD